MWTRSLIVLPDGTSDAETAVAWLQGRSFFADLRQPAGRPDMTGGRGLDDLSAEQMVWLATQEGFAGVLAPDADCIAWTRRIDYQPPSPHPDVARARFEAGVLVETGRDVPYVEYWRRDAEPPESECFGARLRDVETGADAWLVRAGEHFMFARARPLAPPRGARLADLVRDAGSLAEMRALVDCEVSLGRVDADGWRIERSTLPFREGRSHAIEMSGSDLALVTEAGRHAWRIDSTDDAPAFL